MEKKSKYYDRWVDIDELNNDDLSDETEDELEDEYEEETNEDEENNTDELNELDDYEDVEDELKSEISEERGGFVHLRYRDSNGRFASPDTDLECQKLIEADRKLDKFIRDYRKKIELPYNEKILLLRLVDDFRNKEKIIDSKGFLNPEVNHFPRLSYHQVFLDFSEKHCKHLGRSAFSQFVNRMVGKGFIKKVKHGHKIYLRITKEGLDRIYKFWEEYPGESWHEP